MRKQINRVFVPSGTEYLDTEQLAAFLNVGLTKAKTIGRNANATVRIGRTTRYHLPTVERYMLQNMQTGSIKK